jgi:indole-3-glycerol phosphate synthase
MSTVLDQIVAQKRGEIERSKARVPAAQLRDRLRDAPPVRGFLDALSKSSMSLIAEVKRASPSAGLLRTDFEPVSIASHYEACGASAISVLTDAPFFQGSIDHLHQVREAVSLPVLRKDFILDPYQVLEARVYGADAVLLIAEILSQDLLLELLNQIHEFGMEPLLELFDAENLPRVLESTARVVGINNRNLRSFVTDINHTIELAPQIPRDRTLVSESGIRTRDDVLRLQAAGAQAILVGESLMRSPDPGRQIAELLGHCSDRI